MVKSQEPCFPGTYSLVRDLTNVQPNKYVYKIISENDKQLTYTLSLLNAKQSLVFFSRLNQLVVFNLLHFPLCVLVSRLSAVLPPLLQATSKISMLLPLKLWNLKLGELLLVFSFPEEDGVCIILHLLFVNKAQRLGYVSWNKTHLFLLHPWKINKTKRLLNRVTKSTFGT